MTYTPPDKIEIYAAAPARSALLMSKVPMPDHLYDELTRHVEILERKILKETSQ